jgi:hypothetical protein
MKHVQVRCKRCLRKHRHPHQCAAHGSPNVTNQTGTELLRPRHNRKTQSQPCTKAWQYHTSNMNSQQACLAGVSCRFQQQQGSQQHAARQSSTLHGNALKSQTTNTLCVMVLAATHITGHASRQTQQQQPCASYHTPSDQTAVPGSPLMTATGE